MDSLEVLKADLNPRGKMARLTRMAHEAHDGIRGKGIQLSIGII